MFRAEAADGNRRVGHVHRLEAERRRGRLVADQDEVVRPVAGQRYGEVGAEAGAADVVVARGGAGLPVGGGAPQVPAPLVDAAADPVEGNALAGGAVEAVGGR